MTRSKDQGSHLRSLACPAEGRHGLVDVDGRPLPQEPRVGFKMKVKWGAHYWQFSGWRVVAVNSRSFYVWGEGSKHRLGLEEWRSFLMERLEEGDVRIVAMPPKPDLRVVP